MNAAYVVWKYCGNTKWGSQTTLENVRRMRRHNEELSEDDELIK